MGQYASSAGQWPALLISQRLSLGDGAHGAAIGAGTAVQASAGVDLVVISTLRDGTHGAASAQEPQLMQASLMT